jgi:transcription antitermination factor NusG
MKAGDRVKIIQGGMEGAVGDVLSVSEEDGTAQVHVSGVVNGLEVNTTDSIDLADLEVC